MSNPSIDLDAEKPQPNSAFKMNADLDRPPGHTINVNDERTFEDIDKPPASAKVQVNEKTKKDQHCFVKWLKLLH